jgi:hypothetical protein
MREANARGDSLKLTEDELAFYDALETNDSAVKVLGDDRRYANIARELVRDGASGTSPSTGPCATTSALSSASW